jgi:mono/diheme cytochrome c family protein
VQAFKINLFDNVRSDSRCGSCHGVGGAATTAFARDDDVNLAYAAANTVVDLFAPADSEMVQRMMTGHNCWLASDDACATIMTTWIENWAGNSVGAEGRKIELEPPIDLRAPGESRNFPDDNGFIFSQTVYPVLTDANFQGNCAQCHSTASAAQQSPFFAEGPVGDSDALLAAYAAARPRINLNLPAASRFVERVRDESHNCWTDDCAADADRLEAAIAAFAAQVDPDAVSDNLVTSMALTLYEGTIASGGNRHEANVIASYEFKEGPGSLSCSPAGASTCSSQSRQRRKSAMATSPSPRPPSPSASVPT